jgi:oligopeptide/dipeptide ABC transporter ATP-binding protein
MQVSAIQNQCLDGRDMQGTGPGRLLEVRGLGVNFCLEGRRFTALDKISFEIAPNEILGLLGESGAGKTTVALSLLKLLPPGASIFSGSVMFSEENLLTMDEKRLRRIRGDRISIIHQDLSALNPVIPVGDQIAEVIGAHRKWNAGKVREEVNASLAAVGLEDYERIYRAYPHQLSGGQRQRIAVAQAIVCKPELIIADEPTAWLDASTTGDILQLLARLRSLNRTSIILISHDPGVLSAIADRVIVLYAGQIIEQGRAREVLGEPLHPYTQALLRCVPRIPATQSRRSWKLSPIPGTPPDPMQPAEGCAFASRCQDRLDICESQPPQLVHLSPERTVRCFKHYE